MFSILNKAKENKDENAKIQKLETKSSRLTISQIQISLRILQTYNKNLEKAYTFYGKGIQRS